MFDLFKLKVNYSILCYSEHVLVQIRMLKRAKEAKPLALLWIPPNEFLFLNPNCGILFQPEGTNMDKPLNTIINNNYELSIADQLNFLFLIMKLLWTIHELCIWFINVQFSTLF